jgi:hypothetical protein
VGKLETPEGPVQSVARPMGDLLVVGPIRNHWPLVFLTFLPCYLQSHKTNNFFDFLQTLSDRYSRFPDDLDTCRRWDGHWPLVFTLPPYGNKFEQVFFSLFLTVGDRWNRFPDCFDTLPVGGGGPYELTGKLYSCLLLIYFLL